MNIFNDDRRKVICINNSDDTYGVSGTGHLLTIGEKYTVTDVDVHSWHTRVDLEEFPGIKFNSVLFEECSEE